ncbi:hypothetical protein EZV62_002343 [Acer yangbiense]|uniref:C2H2-type domain-containing protein n=1 Tax=Acer yangbiense TaxID=1000413 RepID=A0A5C7IY01_9ROSI|nr:hypothetical protein EZV62_002343 [Acer yangbiense]
MISDQAATGSSCFPNVSQQGLKLMYPPMTADQSFVSSSVEVSGGRSSETQTHSNSLLYSLSLLKEKVHQVQGLVGILISSDHNSRHQQQPESTRSIAIANMSSIVPEIIMTASTILFTCQQMTHGASGNNNNSNVIDVPHEQRVKVAEIDHGLSTSNDHQPHFDHGNIIGQERSQGFYSGDQTFENWYGTENNYYNCNSTDHDDPNRATMNTTSNIEIRVVDRTNEGLTSEGANDISSKQNNSDIIELDAANLLAKYTHYCQVCGKGFKRDANLRMHMRAHGDEYKTSAALTNPLKNINHGNAANNESAMKFPARKYSCPQQGCRWNQKHAKFQPLKSMICVKNHYKRSHCPKMYVCKRCNRKQFSVLSDLRTHEKHCGDLKWQCSCGTTFSRKDKLMGHVALFIGHTPLTITSTATSTSTKPKVEKINQAPPQMQSDHRY